MKIRTKLKIEKFFKEELWQLLLVIAILLFCGYLFNKIIVAVLFAIAHTVIRVRFDKQYHCSVTYHCLILTSEVAFFGISTCLPLTVSLLSVIPVCYFICWLGYIAQDRIDCYKIITKLKDKNIWQMNENELLDYCFAKGIRGDMAEFVIMVVIQQMSFSEIAERLYVSVDTLKHCWSPKCKDKLHIKNWNN